MRIVIGNDHSAVSFKKPIITHLLKKGYHVVDLGVSENKSVDYPDYGEKVGNAVINEAFDFGIIICGTGIGISIAANKVKGIRAALIHDVTTSRLAKEHNNANVIALGARILAPELAIEMIDTFIATSFDERHQKRLKKIGKICSGDANGK